MAGQQHGADLRQRVIRVFVSSTFRDMQEEREILVKRVFRELRKLCEERGVTWGEVDLRWGITEEQRAEGKVLPICLAEIERCRPYFIGLLGERYGWVPHSIPEDLVERQPWLAEHRERSVTELEILHGVLNDPAMADRAFFYLRDPAYLDSLPSARQRMLREHATEAEIRLFGRERAEGRARERRRKLSALKQLLRESAFPVRDGYADPEELGRLVRRDLTEVIDDLFPAGEEPSPLDREALAHEAFARSRASVYVERPDYFACLNRHADGGGPPLVVLGESGAGKSALLANWALRYGEQHPDRLLIVHFIGSSAHSADWRAMIRRIVGELRRGLDIECELSQDADGLRAAFANALHMAHARGRLVLVLDGLNQLEDREQAPDLVWLPPAIPANIRLILSTLPGPSLDELEKRNWPTMAVPPLTAAERQRLIRDYLAGYSKELNPERVERIAAALPTGNPLYLSVLLEELRLFGVHEALDQRIEHYLEARDVPRLYEKVLARLERDYDKERWFLVRDTMVLLWAARRGLSEAEILDLLGTAGKALPRAQWSPLYLDMEQALVRRAGLLGFTHDYLRKAVEHRYLDTPAAQREVRLRLADYFASHETGPRKVEELPWLLSKAETWRRLHDLLADVHFLDAAWRMDEIAIREFWAMVERNSPCRMLDAYAPVLKRPQQYGDHAWNVALLLSGAGHPREALLLYEYLAGYYQRIRDRERRAAALGGRATVLRSLGELDRAMELHREEERICLGINDRDGVQRCLGHQAAILRERGEFDEALALFKRQENICRSLADRHGLQFCLGNQALVLKTRGNLDGAMALHREEERLCREHGNLLGLAGCLENQADIHKTRGDLEGAVQRLEKAEAIWRRLGHRRGLAYCLGSRAVVRRLRGDLDGALKLHREEESLCRDLGHKLGLAACLGNQAVILRIQGDPDGALTLHREEADLCRRLGNRDGLSFCLGNQALILKARGDLDGALELHREEEAICREIGKKAGLAGCLGNMADVLRLRGDLDGALAKLEEQEEICAALGNRDGLSFCLGQQALVHRARGDLDTALALHRREETICRQLGKLDGLQGSLGNQAVILKDRGDLDAAMELFSDQARICRRIGHPDGRQFALGNQAIILRERGKLEPALALHREEESICRKIGNVHGIAASLGNQGQVFRAMGDYDQALELHRREERIYRDLRNPDGIARSLTSRASLLGTLMGRPDEALPLIQEAHRLAVRHGFDALAGAIARIRDEIRTGRDKGP